MNNSYLSILQGKQKHPFHLVDPSPWPLFSSIGGLTATMGGVLYFHGYIAGDSLLLLGISIILYSMFVWWRDIIREGTFQGLHTKAVQHGLRSGMIFFIVSEIMFFFAFFLGIFSLESFTCI